MLMVLSEWEMEWRVRGGVKTGRTRPTLSCKMWQNMRQSRKAKMIKRSERSRESSDGWTLKTSNPCHLIRSEPKTSQGLWHGPDRPRYNEKERRKVVPFWQELWLSFVSHPTKGIVKLWGNQDCSIQQLSQAPSVCRLAVGERGRTLFFHIKIYFMFQISSDPVTGLWGYIRHLLKRKKYKMRALLIHSCTLSHWVHKYEENLFYSPSKTDTGYNQRIVLATWGQLIISLYKVWQRMCCSCLFAHLINTKPCK